MVVMLTAKITSFVTLLLCCFAAISPAWAGGIPVEDKSFLLSTDELITHYRSIPTLHGEPKRRSSNLSIEKLTDLWGSPNEKRENHSNLLGSAFLGAASIIFVLPNPLLAIGFVTGIATTNYLQTEETLIWDKGDYLIEVNTRSKSGTNWVSSWKWNYKSLDSLVPIIGTDTRNKNYFLVGFGRGLESIVHNKSSYANGQYILFGRHLGKIGANNLVMELGAQWGLPGKSTPDAAQWVRIPFNVLLKTPFSENGFSYGAGIGYQFSKEFSSFRLDQNTLQSAKSAFGFVEYRFSKRLTVGVKNDLQWISQSLSANHVAVNQISSYAGVRF